MKGLSPTKQGAHSIIFHYYLKGRFIISAISKYEKKNVNLLLLLIYYFKKHNMVKHYEMTKVNLEMNENTNQKIDRSR